MSDEEKHEYVLKFYYSAELPIFPSKKTEKVRYTVGVSKPTLHTVLK